MASSLQGRRPTFTASHFFSCNLLLHLRDTRNFDRFQFQCNNSMALCKMEIPVVGNTTTVGLVCARRGLSFAKPLQRVAVTTANRSILLRAQLNATSNNADPPHKNYDVSEVVERVVHEEENQLPAEDRQATPGPLPEGEPSPFTPAEENTDDPFVADEPEAGIYKDSLIMPSKAAATSLAVGEQSALATPDLHSSGKRDWRVHAADGDSDGYLQEIFENEGGKSVDDYKLRAHIFSESAVFFTALKNRVDSPSVV